MSVSSYIDVLCELHKIFDQLNIVKFQGELERPTIVIYSDKRGKFYGHCSVSKVWVEGGNESYEINITAEFLNRPIDAITITMLHEMVHESNFMKGIRDCSNSQYHNKKFRDAAESVGLIVEKSDKKGWSITRKCDEPTTRIIGGLDINRDVFGIYRKSFPKPEKEKTESYKYICPKCGVKFTLKKNLQLICKECEAALIVEVKVPKGKGGE